MEKNLKLLINRFHNNDDKLNRILVTLFVNSNSIPVKNNELIKSLLVKNNSALYKEVKGYTHQFNFDHLIEAFELAVPNGDKVINGAVYTPNYIKGFIVDEAFKRTTKDFESVFAADISCGCGAFLFTIAQKIKTETGKSFFSIFKDNLFGADISFSSIERSRILLALLALANGEDRRTFDFNLYCGNSLDFDWFKHDKRVKKNSGFDIVVGNPPYVRAKNIDAASKRLLMNWSVTRSGNPDLYIPFFEIGLYHLTEDGILGYITVNSFYQSVNSRELRRYFSDAKCDLRIIDFGHERIFSKKLAYTCICFVSKKRTNAILFKKENSTSLVRNGMKFFSKILYRDLNFTRGWLLNDRRIIENIKRIEAAGKPLGGSYKIKNGIATLSNETYIFRPIEETKEYYTMEHNGKKYEIEKAICREIIKPNILKYEHEIDSVKERLIFPYTKDSGSLTLIPENQFKRNYPRAYQYLHEYRSELARRDKGNGQYESWYAFGRSQALMDYGNKLLFPYMAKVPYFVFTDNKEMLIYCGYAIFHESEEELKVLKRILESEVFEYYMVNTSKPYSSGYFSYAKNYVKNFGVCDLNDAERRFLLNGASKKEINEFLIKKYGIELK